jgi:hypothetical protein
MKMTHWFWRKRFNFSLVFLILLLSFPLGEEYSPSLEQTCIPSPMDNCAKSGRIALVVLEKEDENV